MKAVAVVAVTVALLACGDNVAPSGTFDIVGHAPLGARGMNSALAIVGDTAYVGSRTDNQPVLIVDISDPTKPNVVGELAGQLEGVAGMSSRELRAIPEQHVLIVLNLRCSTSLHGCGPAAATTENIAIYDITDPRAPFLRDVHYVFGSVFRPRSPHEMFVWIDPLDVTHALVFVTTPAGPPSLEIFSVADASNTLAVWDPIGQGGLPASASPDNILHSISTSDDGRVAFLSHQTDGLAVLDTSSVIDTPSAIAMQLVSPPSQVLDWLTPEHPGVGPHSAVTVPGRPLLVVTEEIYAPPYGIGCPWGHLRTVDITDPTHPVIAGEFALPENDPSYCASGATTANVAFTAHNATATQDLALVTWYAGGLQAIDISDPAHPAQLAELRPDPLPAVTKEDPALDGAKVEMWSYPIIKDGLVYVIDVRNGLYILRYHGAWSYEIAERQFLEGNSNLGAYLSQHP